jgi:hypothetical protein
MNDSVKFLIEQAMTGFDQLSASDRIRLLQGVSCVAPKDSPEADAANHAAWLISKADAAQLQFRSLLSTSK